MKHPGQLSRRRLLIAVASAVLSMGLPISGYSVGSPSPSSHGKRIVSKKKSSIDHINHVFLSIRGITPLSPSQLRADVMLAAPSTYVEQRGLSAEDSHHPYTFQSSFDNLVVTASEYRDSSVTTTTTLVQPRYEDESNTPSANGIGLALSSLGQKTRAKIEKLGIFPFIVYNAVSQINFGVCVSTAWCLYSMRTGLSPLAPGQWKGFLSFYARFLVCNQFVRPFRLAASITLSPKLESISCRLQEHFEWSRTKAILVTFAATYAMAFAFSATCFLSSPAISGVPIFPSH